MIMKTDSRFIKKRGMVVEEKKYFYYVELFKNLFFFLRDNIFNEALKNL